MNYVSKIYSYGEGFSKEDVRVKIGVIKLALREKTALDNIDIKFYDDGVPSTFLSEQNLVDSLRVEVICLCVA